MQEIITALFAIGIGVLFCFYGFKAMRVLLPLWGLVAGYYAGAGLVHAITGDTIFSTALAIGVGIAFALVFAVLAYLFYAVAIIIFMGMVGYWVGAGLLILIGVDPGLLTFLAGAAVAVVFAVAGLLTNMPKFVLLFLTAFFGGALMVTGVLVMANVVELSALRDGTVAVITNQSWIWQLTALTVGVVGFITQWQNSEKEALQWQKEWEVN